MTGEQLVHRYDLATAAETHQFGRALAALLRPGDLVVLTGPLGAGKTVVVQGVGAGLGVLGSITSPTFVIARVHRPDPAAGGSTGLVHADAYRLGATTDPLGEVDALDLDATLEDSITMVEWGEGLVEQLVDAYLEIDIERQLDETRVITLLPHGGDWAARLAGDRLL